VYRSYALTKEEKPDLIDEYGLINRIQEDERTKKTGSPEM